MLVGLAVGIPVSVVFLALAIRGADLDDVRAALADARSGPLALALGLLVVVYGTQAERWRRIAAVPALPWRAFAEMVVEAVACNNVLPARIGDVLRADWLRRRGGITAGRALATVILDRSCDVLVLFAFLLATLSEVTDSRWSQRITIATFVLVTGIVLLLVFARAYARRRPRGRIHVRRRPRRVVRDVVERLAEPMGRRRVAVALAFSVVAWLAFAGAVICVARSVDVRLSFVDAVFATAVINLGVAIPSSPGFVGTYQWLGVAALGVAGVDRSTALAFAILLQATWYIPTTLIGGGMLAARGAKTVTRSRRVSRVGNGSAS